MSQTYPSTADPEGRFRPGPGPDSAVLPAASSAVSWGAILAGAAAAAALSLVLLMLGVGLGLSSVSPWARDGITAATFGVSTVVWITVTQLAASAFGGYLAGRLRHRWAHTDSDEVYFRDTAHGFLAWAIASLVTVTLLTSAVGSILSGGAQAAGAAAAGGAQVAGAAVAGGAQLASKGDSADASMGYFVDSLFRKDASAAEAGSTTAAGTADAANSAEADAGANRAMPGPASPAPLLEVGRIFANNPQGNALSQTDARYVGQLVAQRTGLTQADAEKRVNTAYAQMQNQLQTAKATAMDAVEKSRKLSAYAALWLFVALALGAFAASWVATIGGRQRDRQI